MTVQDGYSYDGYGVMLGSAANAENTAQTNLLYCGEQYDKSLSQYYLRARYYNPLNGLFDRMDPYSGNMQDPQSLHKYTYCHNNPVNGVDPSGMMEFSLGGLLANISIKAVMTKVVIGGILGAGIGGIIGAYFHIVQYQTFEGIWSSIGRGAIYGAILGAILGGLGAVSAKAFAVGLAASFGINLVSTVQILLDPKMRPETKAAAVLFLLLQATLSFRAIMGGFSSGGSSNSGVSGTGADIVTSAKQAAQGVEPDSAYIGYIDQTGRVGLIKCDTSQGLFGHSDAVAKGLIPEGSNGFSLVTNNQGEIAVLTGKSGYLNNPNTGYSLPTSLWSAIKSGLKSVLKQADNFVEEK